MFVAFTASTSRAGICVACLKLTTLVRRIVNRLYLSVDTELTLCCFFFLGGGGGCDESSYLKVNGFKPWPPVQNRGPPEDIFCMFHVTWTTFKFSRNQMGTVLAHVMSSVP